VDAESGDSSTISSTGPDGAISEIVDSPGATEIEGEREWTGAGAGGGAVGTATAGGGPGGGFVLPMTTTGDGFTEVGRGGLEAAVGATEPATTTTGAVAGAMLGLRVVGGPAVPGASPSGPGSITGTADRGTLTWGTAVAAGIQLGAARGGKDADAGMSAGAPNPGNERRGAPRHSFHMSVASGGRTGRFTNMWSNTAICT
jgi:hypothetical protein